jgi:type VI secretion system lysozyme-related protein
MGGSLFERLTLGEAGAYIDEDESIRNNLTRMLTARQGSVQAAPDYGLPDLNDLTLSRAELILENCAAIKSCIDAYEPRLHEAVVQHVELEGMHFTQGFHISALKQDRAGRLVPWSWTFTVDGEKLRGR